MGIVTERDLLDVSAALLGPSCARREGHLPPEAPERRERVAAKTPKTPKRRKRRQRSRVSPSGVFCVFYVLAVVSFEPLSALRAGAPFDQAARSSESLISTRHRVALARWQSNTVPYVLRKPCFVRVTWYRVPSICRMLV